MAKSKDKQTGKDITAKAKNNGNGKRCMFMCYHSSLSSSLTRFISFFNNTENAKDPLTIDKSKKDSTTAIPTTNSNEGVNSKEDATSKQTNKVNSPSKPINKTNSPPSLKRAAGGTPQPKPPSFKKRDYSNKVNVTKCEGNVCLYNIKKPDDDAPAYKGDLNKAIDAGKEKNIQNKAGVFAKFSYKADPSAESKPVVVGKKTEYPDKIYAGYYEHGDNENEVLGKNVSIVAASFMTHTSPYKQGGPKIKAKACGVTNPDRYAKLDEFLFDGDVAFCITQMYSADMFCDEAGDDILKLYFGFLSLDEARELVIEEFEKGED